MKIRVALLKVLAGTCLAGSVALAADPEFTLLIQDNRFVPATLVVPANQKFKLLVKNEGAASEEFESIELKKEKIIPAGKTASFSIPPLSQGEYPFFGDFHPDTAQGKLIAK